MNVGEIDLGLSVNQQMFNRQLNGLAGGAQRAAGGAFSGLGKTIGKVLGVAAVVAFGKSCLDLGSDLAEVQNVVDVTFGSMASQVNAFASTALQQFGLSETAAKQYTGTMGAMLKSSGLATDQALEMSKAITGLSGDMASFYNLETEQAFEKIRSGISGEIEPLRQLGINMSVANLEAYALSKGITKSYQSMSQAEQTMLRYNYLLSVTKDAQGDFARTSDSWANQTRILAEQFNALKASIGQGLIAVLTPVIRALNTLVAKLRVAAEAFRSFVEMVFGKQAPAATMAADVGDISAGASSASDNIEAMGDAAKSAGKKAHAALMGFDEINKLGDSDSGSDSLGSGLGDMGTSMASVDFGKVDTGATKLDGTFNKLIEDAKRLKDLFAGGFKLGLGEDFNTRLSDIKTSLEGIKKGLNDITKDEKVTNSFGNLVNSTATNAGKVAGSIASVGTTIAQNLVGGIDKGLEQNKDYIKRRVVGIMDASAETSEIVGNYAVAWADIFSVFGGEDGQQITANVTAIATNVSLGVSEIFTKLRRDILNAVIQPIVDNKDNIKTSIENTLSPLASVTSTINEGIKTSYDNLVSTYDAKVAPMLQSFADGISNIMTVFLDGYNEHMAPTLNRLADKFDKLWQEAIQPCLNQAVELMGELADTVKTVWEKAVQPLAEYIAKTVIPLVSIGIGNICSLLIGIISVAANVIKDVTQTIQGLVTFINGIFKRDWYKAWDGITLIVSGAGQLMYDTLIKPLTDVSDWLAKEFKTAWDTSLQTIQNTYKGLAEWFELNVTDPLKTKFSTAWGDIKTKAINAFTDIKNGVKTAINGMIGHINGLIRKINKIGIDLPEQLGGGHIGFNVAEIPQLARGGIVSQPTLAMVGEAGKEAIVPLENTGFVTTLANAIAGAIANSQPQGQGSSGGETRIVLQLSDKTIADVTINEITRRSKQSGKFIFSV